MRRFHVIRASRWLADITADCAADALADAARRFGVPQSELSAEPAEY